MDILTLKKAQRHTNEQVIQKATNSPTQTVSFDGGIYSLPSNVINGQVSDIRILGNSLKNELNYNRDTWAEWNKTAGVTGDSTGLNLVADGVNWKYGSVVSNFKPNTKYGILYSVISSTLTGSFVTGIEAFPPTLLPKAIGNNKAIATSKTDISSNIFKVQLYNNEPSGNAIKIRDIRIFELPTGSQIETDFNTLTADQLAQKYPYIKGDSVKSTVGASRLKSVGKNLFDGNWEDGAVNSSGKKTSLEDSKRNKNKIKVIPNQVYVISGCKFRRIVYYDTNDNFLFTTTDVVSTAPVNASYLIFAIDTTVSYTNTQLEPGTVATPYEPYKESIVYVNLPTNGELRSLPNGVYDEFNATTGIKTQRNGTKTNVNSGTVINYADMATGGQFVAYAADGTSQVGVKGDTLTITAVSLTYQLAEPIVTDIPKQKLEVFENGTVYVEPMGDPAESTVPSVEMTIPTGTSNKFGVATHNYGGAAADWVLTNSESKCFLLAVSNAGGSANIIAPDAPGVMYAISNKSGQTVTVKISGGTGVAITNAKTVLVIHNGTDYTALTAEL